VGTKSIRLWNTVLYCFTFRESFAQYSNEYRTKHFYSIYICEIRRKINTQVFKFILLRRRIECKIEDGPKEDHFEFRKVKENRGAIGVLIISEWTLDIGEELRVLHRLAEGN
jgi:hypothetical protein